jgi:cullin-4
MMEVETNNKKTTPKKLTISFKARKPTLPASYESETWEILKSSIVAVQTKQSVSFSKEELYKAVENLVDHKLSENLYSNLEKQCALHIEGTLQGLLDEGYNLSPEAFLLVVNRYWNDHCQGMTFIRSIFLYLDRKYALQNPNIKSIWDLGLFLFCKYIITVPEVEEKLRIGLLRVIEADRRGDDVDKILLKNLFRMLSSLNLYSKFEKYFLQDTALFYQKESEKYFAELQIADVLIQIERRIEEESLRIMQYLDNCTKKSLINTLENVALSPFVDIIIERGFNDLLDKNSVEDLKRMFGLFQRVDASEKIKVAYNHYIKERGEQIVSNQQRDETMIEDLLSFKGKIDEVLKLAFSVNATKSQVEEFAYASKEAFEYFINKRQGAPAELLAKFIDSKLKTGKDSRALNETELEVLLDRVMQIFRFINGKDVFEAFYKKDLSKRLLLSKFSSMEAEKSMIQKLKTECGAGFTRALEGMFKDIDISSDMADGFKESKFYYDWSTQNHPFQFRTLVLTVGYWPPYPQLPCTVPIEINNFCKAFEGFYLDKHSGRRLVWNNSLSQCTVRATFTSGHKELTLSFYQAVILLLFNDHENLTFKDIAHATQIEIQELKRTLTSLVLGVAKLVGRTDAKTKDISENDEFFFRKEFASKSRHIKINTLQLAETKQENEKTQENIFKDRQYQVDAAIVRIMKTRKSLPHQQLITELFQHLKFPAKTSDLKKRIDSLIEREFIERDPHDHNNYLYMA